MSYKLRHNRFGEKMPTNLSIVIPAYKESERLPGNLHKICRFLENEKLEKDKSEIIIVLEECEDREISIEAIEKIKKEFPSINIIYMRNDGRFGKGYTIRRGVLVAKGEYILMTDADLSVPIEELNTVWSYLKNSNYDCVIGKRVQIIKQPPHRKIMGWGFRTLTKTLLRMNFHDTQCGFKLFTNDFGKQVFKDITIPGFGFDIEMLALGLQKDYKIGEKEVKWYDDARSTVDPIKDSLTMFGNLLEVRKNIKNIKRRG